MILPYQHIRDRRPYLVSPFVERGVANGMSFGVGPCGYDIRISGDTVVPATGKVVLASSLEHFNMHDDLLGSVRDKSSWARQGLAVQNTVIEPGWRGWLTLELTNHGPQTFYIPGGSPIAQIVFELLAAPTQKPYEGKYQDAPPEPQACIYEPNA